jgi:hypothetical protein
MKGDWFDFLTSDLEIKKIGLLSEVGASLTSISKEGLLIY